MRFTDLYAQAQRNRIDFVQTDLELCFTFADLVETELDIGDLKAATRIKQKAEDGYHAIARLTVGINAGGDRRAIEGRLTQLRARLDAIGSRI